MRLIIFGGSEYLEVGVSGRVTVFTAVTEKWSGVGVGRMCIGSLGQFLHTNLIAGRIGRIRSLGASYTGGVVSQATIRELRTPLESGGIFFPLGGRGSELFERL